MSSKNNGRDMELESRGWLSMILILFLFPALFFLCVYFPLWMGWAGFFEK